MPSYLWAVLYWLYVIRMLNETRMSHIHILVSEFHPGSGNRII